MTPLARRLGQRTFTPAVRSALADPRRQRTSLSELRTHQSGRILGYVDALPADHSRRLFDLGFAPGARVDVVRRAPALDPTIYRVAGSEIALRRSLARWIEVEPT